MSAKKHTQKIAGYYDIIHNFFDSYTLATVRGYLLSAIKAAESKRIWQTSAPGDLLFLVDRLHALIPAVYGIVPTIYQRHKAMLPPNQPASPAAYDNYSRDFDDREAWDNFPRSLSHKEFNNPYRALQKFTSWSTCKEWHQTLSIVLSYALGKGSLADTGLEMQTLQIYELLVKMVEACHLIDLRSYAPTLENHSPNKMQAL